MTTSLPAPTPTEITRLLETMRQGRQRLLSLLAHGADVADLADVVDELGGSLLAADERLRAQNEQIAQSTRQLNALVALHEEMFENAPAAYLQTDANGLLLRVNAAARRLLDPAVALGCSTSLVSLVAPDDRVVVRSLISSAGANGGRPAPAEVSVRRRDGRDLPALLQVRRTATTGSARTLLHWQVQERTPSPATNGGRTRPAPASTVVQALAGAAAALHCRQTRSAAAAEVLRQLASVLPDVRDAELTPMRRIPDLTTTIGELGAAVETLQRRRDETPARAAMNSAEPVRISDFTTEARWPAFATAAAALGARSAVVVPLIHGERLLGALSIYSRQPSAFTAEDEVICSAFAVHAASALARAEVEENLRTGMQTRQEIGQAVGILIERHRITADEAFALLVVASQQSRVKLRDVAARLVETGEDPAHYRPESFA